MASDSTSNPGLKAGNGGSGRSGRRSERTIATDLAYIGVAALVTAPLFLLGDYLEAWMKIRKIEKEASSAPDTTQTPPNA